MSIQILFPVLQLLEIDKWINEWMTQSIDKSKGWPLPALYCWTRWVQVNCSRPLQEDGSTASLWAARRRHGRAKTTMFLEYDGETSLREAIKLRALASTWYYPLGSLWPIFPDQICHSKKSLSLTWFFSET